jgi:hypothetical protein
VRGWSKRGKKRKMWERCGKALAYLRGGWDKAPSMYLFWCHELEVILSLEKGEGCLYNYVNSLTGAIMPSRGTWGEFKRELLRVVKYVGRLVGQLTGYFENGCSEVGKFKVISQ